MQRRSDRIAELEVFVSAVDAGSLAGGARSIGIVPSAASRTITRLENRLGVQLLRRSTRQIALTEEGRVLLARARALLSDLDTAEREASTAAEPSGRVRVSSSASYVVHVLARILPGFGQRYPSIGIDVRQEDTVADLVSEPVDLAIRAGPLTTSDLIARSLGATRIIAVAAPAWIKANGEPEDDRHFIGFTYQRRGEPWTTLGGNTLSRFRISDGEGLRQLALAALGPIHAAEFTVRDDVADGRLTIVASPGSEMMEAFHAVFVGPSRILPRRVRVLLDYLAEHGRVS